SCRSSGHEAPDRSGGEGMGSIVKRTILVASLVAAVTFAGPAAASGTLRIALQEDPDALDPAQGVSFVGRVVFAGLCDKLIDIDQKLAYVPALATSWAWSADNLALTMTLRPGVLFHDATAFDAAAVKANIE